LWRTYCVNPIDKRLQKPRYFDDLETPNWSGFRTGEVAEVAVIPIWD